MQTPTTPLTTVTVAMFDVMVDALDVMFPDQDGHNDLLDEMLDAGVLDADAFDAGRRHADELAILGTRPSLDHAPVVGMLVISGFSHTLGFAVQTLTRYND